MSVDESSMENLRESILSPKFNFGAPSISAINIQTDGTLELEHNHKSDGRGLDLQRAEKVLSYIHRVWRRPVVIHTVNEAGDERTVMKAN
jgi:stage V sporulation protein R